MSFQAAKDRFLNMSLQEKRQEYKCGDSYVTLADIPPWSKSARTREGQDISPTSAINEKISIFQGDITKLEIDAIVNAANARLAGGGGVDGFIHRGAGAVDLQAECQSLGGCETGQCKMTGGYRLPAKYIIHCVGPIGEKPELLASCYKNALDTLKAAKLRTIAFPCISTGVYGYPNDNAADVVLKTVKTWLEDSANQAAVDRIIFALFLDRDLEAYKERLPRYFPQ